MTNTEQYMNLLYKKYNKTQLTRKEVAEVLEISLTSLDTLISNKTLPIRFKRIGSSQKARYIFPILEVANFLAFEDVA
ncbi:hypothetical protein [Sulfurimonas sp. NWX367]|uniref:hypothetical protein n=1 Tax=Sulfurimonas sp. NWX367 TaxID=2925413 RepID=UPI003204A8FD